ncbi:MAG: Dam family site-specific DNA-(adenine-N6)-methyltransferase [Dehalococcoidia bacterium]|jgi:DNA adenine methylase
MGKETLNIEKNNLIKNSSKSDIDPWSSEIVVRPFLRWVGGKTWFLKEISQFSLENINNYYEPFVGGGSVFFYLSQIGKLRNKVVLSDINKELIDCYIQLRDNVEDVIKHLQNYKNEEYVYYSIRGLTPSSDSEAAAKFIYLNRTSFNGIYRVNLNGVYNVPYGFKNYTELFDYNNLRRVSEVLAGINIIHRDFQAVLSEILEGDLVFLDPPYTVAHDNNGFIKYNQKLFAWSDQERLKETVKLIAEKGAYFILTNAANPSINTLFGSVGTQIQLSRYSVIGGKKAKRGIINEYVFSNITASKKEKCYG